MKKSKIDTTDQVNTSNENETTSSDNATQPDNESDEPSIKTSEIPQDLSALGKPRRVPSKNYVFPEEMLPGGDVTYCITLLMVETHQTSQCL